MNWKELPTKWTVAASQHIPSVPTGQSFKLPMLPRPSRAPCKVRATKQAPSWLFTRLFRRFWSSQGTRKMWLGRLHSTLWVATTPKGSKWVRNVQKDLKSFQVLSSAFKQSSILYPIYPQLQTSEPSSPESCTVACPATDPTNSSQQSSGLMSSRLCSPKRMKTSMIVGFV